MGLRSWLAEQSSSVQARRLFALGTLLFAGGCVATFQACSANDDQASSTQTQALQSSGDPSGNRGGSGRTGEYVDTTLTTTLVSSSTFGRAPTAYSVTGPVYAQPVVAQNVAVASDYPRNVLIVATTMNYLYAYDADRVGSLIWQKGPEIFHTPINMGRNADSPPEAGIAGNPLNCPNIGNVGILSTPYVDTATSTVYVVVESLPTDLDAQNYSDSDPPVFTLWALDLTTGSQKSSVTLSGSSAGVSFDAYKQIQRAALTPVTVGAKTFLLIGFSSSCDVPVPYYGWVFSREITNPNALGSGAAGVYCATCGVATGGGSGQPGGGIWQSGMGFAVDNNNNVYFQNGNGVGYEAGNSATFSNSVFKMQVASDGSMTVSDFFTPSNQAYLSANDLDLGVSGVAWLGGNDGGGPNVLLSGSKQGRVYLLDPGSLGGYGSTDNVLSEVQGTCGQFDPSYWCSPDGHFPSFDPVSQPANCQGAMLQPDEAGFDPLASVTCFNNQQNWPHIHGAPVYWAETNYVYFMGQYDYLRRLQLDPTSRTFITDAGDSFAFADGGQIAPTTGYGGLISLSYNPNAPSGTDGILWVNARLPKEDADWAVDTNPGYTNTHSGAELSPGALYAVDARQMTKLFADAPVAQANSFLVSKFTTPTIFSGRVYEATMSNEILVYCNDQDADGICDTMDNCPTVANADQTNSNYDAERLITGTPILGDACDPNATTSLLPLPPNGTNGDSITDGVSVSCTEVILGCSSSSTNTTTCKRRFNTNLTFNAHIGDDAGTAPAAAGTSAPAFCKCTASTQYLCLTSTGGCDGAHDSEFPTLDGGASAHWNAISQLSNGSAQWFSPIGLTHVEPWNAYAGSTKQAAWDYPYDLSRLGSNVDAGVNFCDGGTCGLQGELWSHVITFSPDAGENALTTNLNNNYVAATAQFTPVYYFQFEPCTIPQYLPWLWGQQSWAPSGWAQDPTWLMPLTSGVGAQTSSDGVGIDVSTNFTSNALTTLESLAGLNGGSFLLDADGARNLGTSKVLGTVMTVPSGTTNVTVSDALIQSGTQIDVQSPVGGATANTISNAVIEALDPESGVLYTLTNGGGTEGLVTMDVVGGLNNFAYAQTSASITGTTFSTTLAMQYSQANGKLYLLDRVASGDVYALRLSSITTAGVMTELWRTSGVALASFPNAFLSASAFGTLVVSVQVGTSTAEGMIVDASGNPVSSYYEAGSMRTRALLGSGQGMWFPLEATSPSGVITLTPTYQPLLLSGICGTSWLLAHAGSGELATSKSSCNPIYNGGFETGTFLDWTATGQAESVSTTNPHTGSYSAMLGSTSASNGDSTVMQTFTVPSGGGTLSFWWSSTCPDTVTYDWFTATLQNTSGATLATVVAKTCASTNAWTQATQSLSRWAGQTVVVVLTSHDDNYPFDPTYSFVDDIKVQ